MLASCTGVLRSLLPRIDQPLNIPAVWETQMQYE
jgi:hypothetical protein